MLEHGKETASENDRLSEGIWRRDLVCNMVGIEYDTASRVGLLWLRHGNCTHMPGAIDLFLAIDPAVEMIFTIQRGERPGDPDIPDTAYSRGRRNPPSPSLSMAEWYSIPHGAIQERLAKCGLHIPPMRTWMT